MRRSSVRSLMFFIVVGAVGLAALRNANVYCAGVIANLGVVALAGSCVAALTLRGREQCAWVGFTVFSAMYLSVTVANVLPDDFKMNSV
jgi:hypothetical protein